MPLHFLCNNNWYSIQKTKLFTTLWTHCFFQHWLWLWSLLYSVSALLFPMYSQLSSLKSNFSIMLTDITRSLVCKRSHGQPVWVSRVIILKQWWEAKESPWNLGGHQKEHEKHCYINCLSSLDLHIWAIFSITGIIQYGILTFIKPTITLFWAMDFSCSTIVKTDFNSFCYMLSRFVLQLKFYLWYHAQ